MKVISSTENVAFAFGPLQLHQKPAVLRTEVLTSAEEAAYGSNCVRAFRASDAEVDNDGPGSLVLDEDVVALEVPMAVRLLMQDRQALRGLGEHLNQRA